MTNFCIFDCVYCVNRVQVERARFTVKEVVRLTIEFYRRNYIEGLFLSSGIIRSPDDTMTDMVRIARTLRETENFRGYIHLKTIPDASPELLDEAGKWADRLSINVEMPTVEGLALLAPEKSASGIRKTMAAVLPSEAIAEIETALCHADPERFARAYGLLRQLAHGTVRWADRSDPAMLTVLQQAKTVRRAIHKMHAFVRFREVEGEAGRRAFMAWFEPDHPVVEAATPFFAKRLGDMDRTILTPHITARYVGGLLDYQVTAPGTVIPEGATERLWRTYYANIFNPARLMVDAMTSEMPRKYWKNLPEADLIPGLIRSANAQTFAMQAAAPTEASPRLLSRAKAMVAQSLPEVPTDGLAGLRAAAGQCARCPLHASATQVVFGVGPEDAALMIVGEQPGDTEDLTGVPLTGPAGQVFDAEALAAGLDRAAAYVTNAVKHFKFSARGKRRIHQRPDSGEVTACRWWLDQERALIRPRLILAMGATALASLTGTGEGILSRRGKVEVAGDGTPVFITVHPSYILRLPDPALQQAERVRFRDDLRVVAAMTRDLAND